MALPGTDRQADTLGDRLRFFFTGVDQQQSKFLTADACGGVIYPRMAFQHRGGELDHFVAGDMAVAIVDAFEMVEVADEHRQRMLGIHLRQLLVKSVVEKAAVVEAGQRVADRILIRMDIFVVRLAIEDKDVNQ